MLVFMWFHWLPCFLAARKEKNQQKVRATFASSFCVCRQLFLTSDLFQLGTTVRAIGELDEHGIDQQAGIIIGFKKGIAILQTSFNADLPNEATIIGTEGRLKIHKPLWCPTRISWHLQNGETDEEDFPLPRVDGTFNFTNSAGLHYEAKHVQQCIYQHKTESEIMPLAETLTIMKTMDAIRNQIGLIYK
jgi:hypothetical protein